MADGNMFGGGNPNFLYAPMSEDEQEVLDRLVDKDAMVIHVVGWGVVNSFDEIIKGDANLKLRFTLTFSSPAIRIPVTFFDLELRLRTDDPIKKPGRLLFKKTEVVRGGDGGALWIGAGDVMPFEWTITIQNMEPSLVKDIKTGAVGLTTREGNRHLKGSTQRVFEHMRRSEKLARKDSQRQVVQAKAESVLEMPD